MNKDVAKELRAVYIRWGRKSCPNRGNTSTVYKG